MLTKNELDLYDGCMKCAEFEGKLNALDDCADCERKAKRIEKQYEKHRLTH